MKSKWFLAWGLAVLLFVNFAIWQKEHLLRSGRTVLLELAPVDPRSLMQGDYMILNYALLEQVRHVKEPAQLVLENDERGVARFVRVHEGTSLPPEAYLIKFKPDLGNGSIGAESFFFQEGDASLYDRAKYGELVVDQHGNSVLVGLRDEALERLGPERQGGHSR